MEVVNDINKVLDNLQKLTSEGVPLKLEHEIDKASISYMLIGVLVVGLVLIALGGFRDYVVAKALK